MSAPRPEGIASTPGAPYPKLIGRLALTCMAAAVLSGTILGTWELAHPFFGHTRYKVVASWPQLWTYAILQVFKVFGFLAGLFGFFLVATQRSFLLKIVMGLAVLGGIFYSIVWIMIAVRVRDDAIYIFKHPIGSDAHSNGGILFLSLAPVALGIASLLGHRISRRQSAWPIIVGLLALAIFGLFPPGIALIIEGAVWMAFGYVVYRSRGAPNLLVAHHRAFMMT